MSGDVLLSLFLTGVIALGLSTLALLSLGSRIRLRSRVLAILLTAGLLLVAGVIAAALWSLSGTSIVTAQAAILLIALITILVLSRWNPVGQIFFAMLLVTTVSYLLYAAYLTVAGGFSILGTIASALLFGLEFLALLLSVSFAFEACDALCRTRPSRNLPPPDPGYLPMVSVHVPAYNEPPDMLIETIASLENLDYPNFEIIVIDNNTSDRETWEPVARYCEDRERIKFVHVENLDGFKAGALNLVLREHVHPDAEIIGIVDSDYIIDRAWLRRLVGHFSDPNVAFVQCPQEYREYEEDAYLTACYDGYKYFFAVTMPSRNQRNSIIFAGTMGLLRLSAIEEIGGWNQSCVTEDAETSLRLLKAGYAGMYVNESLGHGIMPLTFSSFKRQRFRWCLGAMQILKMHWRSLLPGRRTAKNRMSIPQRIDYTLLVVQWMNDLLNIGFVVVLAVSAALLVTRGGLQLRPLEGALVLLPAALISSGLLRAIWTLRRSTGITLKRSVLALINWMSTAWTVAVACVQGLLRREAVFMRTPKHSDRPGLLNALWETKVETSLALGLWAAGGLVAVTGRATPLLVGLFVWQGGLYASAPFMSWLNLHTELSAQLERRRRTEQRRERIAALTPYYVGAASSVGAAALVAAALFFGGAEPGSLAGTAFEIPRAANATQGPLDVLGERLSDVGTAVLDGPPAPDDDESATEEDPEETPLPEETDEIPTPTPAPSPTVTE